MNPELINNIQDNHSEVFRSDSSTKFGEKIEVRSQGVTLSQSSQIPTILFAQSWALIVNYTALVLCAVLYKRFVLIKALK